MSLHGCGTTDMKSGDAVFLHLAATVTEPAHDLTLVFYDCEEIESAANGLGRIERELPDWLAADVAILGEPTGGYIEAGCQGTLRVVVHATGTRAHSARSWLGDNAIHKLGAVLDRLADYQARSVEIDGCTYREGLSAVRIDGGVAGNVIPDAASLTVNFRFAPDRVAGRRAAATSTRCSTASTCGSSRPTPRPGRCPGCPGLPPRPSSTRPTGRCGRNTGGPTCRGSPPGASPRSTTDPVIPTWRTPRRAGARRPDHRRGDHAAGVPEQLSGRSPLGERKGWQTAINLCALKPGESS